MKRSKGVTIFGILLILGSLFQFGLKHGDIKPLFEPLPEKIILLHYFVGKILLILGIIAGIGISYLKNIFRKIILFISWFNIFTYLLELPFFISRNVPKYIEQQVTEVALEAPMIPESTLYSIFWTLIIIGWIIDFGFSICLIYFFIRSEVKAQFKQGVTK